MNGPSLFLVLLFAVAGWQHARHLEKKYGRSAFGWPDWVWGVVCAFSLLVGIVLLVVAERRLRKAPAAVGPAGYGAPGYGPVAGNPVFSPWSTEPAGYGQAQAYAPVAAAEPVVPAAAPGLPPAGWAPDPSGRHELRWWDGASWTAAVHNAGVTSSDG